MGDGADPRLDVVEAQRSGQAHGASFTLPSEADEYRRQAAEALDKVRALPEDKQRDFLVDSGYLVPHWPKPWGRAADVLEQLVIEEEFADVKRADMGITGWVALTIAQAGTDDQRERWVEPVLRGQMMWCQLFSEPGAGSDAAAVRTAAKKVDGGWRVTGQKVWTSLAQHCQWGLATVRTDPDAPKHAGVTMIPSLGYRDCKIRSANSDTEPTTWVAPALRSCSSLWAPVRVPAAMAAPARSPLSTSLLVSPSVATFCTPSTCSRISAVRIRSGVGRPRTPSPGASARSANDCQPSAASSFSCVVPLKPVVSATLTPASRSRVIACAAPSMGSACVEQPACR